MTHEELHALLPTYAAGNLPATQAQAVRGHLATGCPECLGDLFRRPVGMPRATAEGIRVRRRAGGGWLAGLGIAAVVVGLGSTWVVQSFRARDGATGALLGTLRAQLERAQEERGRLTARGDALERDLAEARADARREGDVAAAAEAARAQAERDLALAQDRIATLTRGVQRRDGEIDRLLSGVDDARALRELLAAPGLRLLDLTAVPPADHGRGHVLWHAARAVVVLSLFDLPPLADGATYRVRLHVEGAGDLDGPTFKPGANGDTIVTIRLRQPPGSRLAVSIERDPAGERVLAGQTAASG